MKELTYGFQVNEEVGRSLTSSPLLRIQQLEEPSTFQFIFSRNLSLPIFTGTKILAADSSPIQILLIDTAADQLVPASHPYPIKVEIVVLDGDFPPGDGDNWTSEAFDKSIVRERAGKRPLLAGELMVTVRDGFAPVGEIEFTDNSSWIRGRKFRLGARVVPGSSLAVRVREAVTESFVVKDHRGELYRKHHPPMLDDEVWRLEKIGKDGVFHKKLVSVGINNVREFLKMSTVEPDKLKKILGVGMSEKMWEVVINHARKCIMGNKLYIFKGSYYTIIFNPICEVLKAQINGRLFPGRDFTAGTRVCLQNLVRDAYLNWNSLEEVDGLLNEMPLLTQGDVVEHYPYNQQHAFLTNGSTVVTSAPSNAVMECGDWSVNSTLYRGSPIDDFGVGYTISESSSSDGDFTPTRSFFHEF
ncbi:hypothetical protein U1Q18_027751 [Sarracenia purpurea var. burkii]